MAVSLIYETHSLTEDNERGLATGWLPGKLSAAGRELAAEMGRRRHDDRVSAVFSSDLGRALETVEIAFGASTIPRFADWRLRECDYGILNGAPVADLAPLRLSAIDRPFPGGQSYSDVVANTRSFLADLGRTFDGRRVLIVAHSANKWALDVVLEGKRLEDLVAADFGWQEGWEYSVSSASEFQMTPGNPQ